MRMLAAWLVLNAAAMLSAQAAPHSWGQRPDGQPVLTLTQPGRAARVLVLYFVASDCPISSRTFPEMKRVREAYERQGAVFWFVYPNAGERPADVRAHQLAFDAGGAAVLDTHGELARIASARVTPEVSVLLPSAAHGWTAVYTGRVDDRYVHIGLERPAATEHFAERVIGAALAGRPVEQASGTPVGCTIVSPAR